MEKNIFEIMNEKQLSTENGTITYWVNDFSGQEYALIFLHGLTADHTLFEKQIAHFNTQFKILCWDAPSHGKSRPYTDFSYSNAARHLHCILEKENIKKAIFIGQSMGGFVIQTFLKQYPDSAIGFIGIDTTPFGLSYYSASDKWWLRQVEWMAHCYPHKLLVKGIAKSCTYTKYAYENMIHALKPYTKKELCHLMGIGFAGFLDENCDLNIKCPVLLLLGEYDKTGKVKQYCHNWHKKTGYPLHIIKNAAHNSNLDNYEQVNLEIETFIRDISDIY